MGICIKDLYDYNLVEKCTKCENICLESITFQNLVGVFL